MRRTPLHLIAARAHRAPLLIAALSLLAACATSGGAERGERAELPLTATLTQLDEVEQSLLGFTATARIELTNPGTRPAKVVEAHYWLLIGGENAAAGVVPIGVALAPGEVKSVEVKAPLRFAESPVAAETASKAKSFDYALRGELAVLLGTDGERPSSSKLQFARGSAVRSPAKPTLALDTFELMGNQRMGLTATAALAVKNANPFPLAIDGITWTMLLAGKEVGSGTIAKGSTLKGNSETTFHLAVTHDPSALKKLGLPYSGKLNYALASQLSLSGAQIALDAKDEAQILRGD